MTSYFHVMLTQNSRVINVGGVYGDNAIYGTMNRYSLGGDSDWVCRLGGDPCRDLVWKEGVW